MSGLRGNLVVVIKGAPFLLHELGLHHLPEVVLIDHSLI